MIYYKCDRTSFSFETNYYFQHQNKRASNSKKTQVTIVYFAKKNIYTQSPTQDLVSAHPALHL